MGGSAKVELSDFTRKPTEDPMTEENITLAELLQKSGEGDFLRTVAEAVLQLLMEADVEGLIGAGGTSALPSGSLTATAIATAGSIRGWARSNSESRSCARARTSRPSWSHAGPARRRWPP